MPESLTTACQHWRSILLTAALLATLPPSTVTLASASAENDSFSTFVNKAAKDQGDTNACLRASTTSDELTLGPCPSGRADDGLAEWATRESLNGFMLVNRYQAPFKAERCLINYQWQARMGACDSNAYEAAWFVRDLQPGYASLQNSYTSEQRCLGVNGAPVTLEKCPEVPAPSSLWSVDGLPRDPELKQQNPEKFNQPRELTITSLPSATAERDRIKQSMLWADWQPLGFYLNPYTAMTVTVGGDLQGATLEMVIGTPSMVLPWNVNKSEILPIFHTLAAGENTVMAPRGGLLAVRLVNDGGKPITLTLKLGQQAEPVPFFSEGTTTNAQWQSMLEVSTIPIVQLVNDKVIIASTLKSMQDAGEHDANALLEVYRQGIDAQNAIAGLDSSTPDNQPSVLRPIVVETRVGVNPSAADYRAMMPYPATPIFNVDGAKKNWGLWHELGHQRQSPIWTWHRGSLTEVTVNVYTLAALHHWFGDDFPVPDGGPSPAHWDRATIYLAAPDEDREFENLEKVDGPITFSMFEQLRVAFGDAFYHKLEQAIRRLEPPDDEAERKRLFQVEASKAANVDLSDYFIKWGLRPDEQTLAAIRALGLEKPSKDPSAVPVFKGSDRDRMLRLWGYWLPNGRLQVDGYAAPLNAHIQVLNSSGNWVEIGAVGEHLIFDNDHLDKGYLADGKQKLQARVKGTPEALTFTVVNKPTVTELTAVRTPENKISIKGRGTPPSAVIEASNQDGSWPGVASVYNSGEFSNDHLGDNHLVDGKSKFTVRMDHGDRKWKERYSAEVAQMLELSGELTERATLIVQGKASPVGATVEALNSRGEWVGIQTVGADGRFINANLNDQYLSDGKQALEVRLRLTDASLTRSMTAKVSNAGKRPILGLQRHNGGP